MFDNIFLRVLLRIFLYAILPLAIWACFIYLTGTGGPVLIIAIPVWIIFFFIALIIQTRSKHNKESAQYIPLVGDTKKIDKKTKLNSIIYLFIHLTVSLVLTRITNEIFLLKSFLYPKFLIVFFPIFFLPLLASSFYFATRLKSKSNFYYYFLIGIIIKLISDFFTISSASNINPYNIVIGKYSFYSTIALSIILAIFMLKSFKK